MADVVGCDDGQRDRLGQGEQAAVEPLLVGVEMALQVEVEIATAEGGAQARAQRARILTLQEQAANRTARASSQADQTCAEAFQILQPYAPLPLGRIDRRAGIVVQRAQLGGSDEPAQVLVAGAMGGQ